MVSIWPVCLNASNPIGTLGKKLLALLLTLIFDEVTQNSETPDAEWHHKNPNLDAEAKPEAKQVNTI